MEGLEGRVSLEGQEGPHGREGREGREGQDGRVGRVGFSRGRGPTATGGPEGPHYNRSVHPQAPDVVRTASRRFNRSVQPDVSGVVRTFRSATTFAGTAGLLDSRADLKVRTTTGPFSQRSQV